MMNRKRLIGLAALLAMGASGCDPADITHVNDNPNNPTTAPAPALFTAAVRNGVARWLGTSNVRGFELVAQHLAEVQYPETDQYRRLDAASTAGLFNGAYNTEIVDLHKIVGSSEPGYAGPARVMRAWSFFNLTDVWGDVPYSQALQGDSVGGTLSPAYDRQQAIYTALFAELARASSDMAAAPASGLRFAAADPLYGGSLPAWQRFSNSLRARHALRVVNVDRATADAQLRAAFSAPGGVFTSNAHNARFVWPGDGVYDNPWATNFKTRDDHRISDRLITILRDREDPRVTVYAMRAERDTTASIITKYCRDGVPCYVGLANALTHAEASRFVPYTSRPGAVFYPGATAYGTYGGNGGSFPSFVMTYAEVAFIQAEAAARSLGGLTPGQAAGFYEAGIRASMEQWGLSSAQADAYLARPAVAFAGGNAGLIQIATEKWIALYAQGIEAWSEFRRTCQPAIIEPGPSAIIAEIPRRYTYSNTEYAVNADAVQGAISAQGPDNFLTRMYWDKAPTTAPTYQAGCGVR